MVVIYYKGPYVPTNNTFFYGLFKFYELFVAYYIPKFTAIDSTSVAITAGTAPAIQAI
jgi:hypothetical protein